MDREDVMNLSGDFGKGDSPEKPTPVDKMDEDDEEFNRDTVFTLMNAELEPLRNEAAQDAAAFE